MSKLTYIVIHCLDTPRGRRIEKKDIIQWHKSPRDENGGVVYLGKKYPSRDALPDNFINGVSIKRLYGRGWDRLGYSDLIHFDGEIENLTLYNDDDIVDPSEMTWGAAGINSISRHVALEGGKLVNGKTPGIVDFFELFSDAQYVRLASYLKGQIKMIPGVKIIGHANVPKSGKTCPGFDVLKFCNDIRIEKVNIGL